MKQHAYNRLQVIQQLVPSTLTNSSVIVPLFGHYTLTITVDWRTGKFEFESEVDLADICKPINQESKNFETVFVEAMEKAQTQSVVYAYERAALMLGLEHFVGEEQVDIVFPQYSPVMISVRASGKKPNVKLLYEKEPLNEHKVSVSTSINFRFQAPC
jgi:hypothetical protein